MPPKLQQSTLSTSASKGALLQLTESKYSMRAAWGGIRQTLQKDDHDLMDTAEEMRTESAAAQAGTTTDKNRRSRNTAYENAMEVMNTERETAETLVARVADTTFRATEKTSADVRREHASYLTGTKADFSALSERLKARLYPQLEKDLRLELEVEYDRLFKKERRKVRETLDQVRTMHTEDLASLRKGLEEEHEIEMEEKESKIHELEGEVETLTTDRDDLKKEVETLVMQRERLRERLPDNPVFHAADNARWESHRRVMDELKVAEEARDAWMRNAEELEAKYSRLKRFIEEKKRAFDKSCAKKDEEIENLEEEVENLEDEVESLQRTSDAVDTGHASSNELRRLQYDVEWLNTTNTNLEDELANKASEFMAKNRRIAGLESRVTSLEYNISSRDAQFEEFRSRERSQDEQLDIQRQTIRDLEATIKDRNCQIIKKDSFINQVLGVQAAKAQPEPSETVNQELQTTRQELSQLKDRNAALEVSLRGLMGNIEAANKKNSELEAAIIEKDGRLLSVCTIRRDFYLGMLRALGDCDTQYDATTDDVPFIGWGPDDHIHDHLFGLAANIIAGREKEQIRSTAAEKNLLRMNEEACELVTKLTQTVNLQDSCLQKLREYAEQRDRLKRSVEILTNDLHDVKLINNRLWEFLVYLFMGSRIRSANTEGTNED
ncbi:hypothetical protein SLS58_004967 [Diplodia intermedia]|uniref:Uncharacterized protein n=1 Tax=Diplodia intermedia TaxID=856260 RepID=A0ABR3TS32_9PEZI